jgi:signal transduction histidine kinase
VADEGERRDLPSGVDLSAYRVVQEALTNTVKHAGATRAHVAIRREPEWLEVEVTDEGRTGSSPIDGDGPGAPPSGGQGLIGMRERVTILGGDLAGPTGTGFAVKARFPLRSAEGVR